VTLSGIYGKAVFANTLDETSFEASATDPLNSQAKRTAVNGGKIALKPYATAWCCVDD